MLLLMLKYYSASCHIAITPHHVTKAARYVRWRHFKRRYTRSILRQKCVDENRMLRWSYLRKPGGIWFGFLSEIYVAQSLLQLPGGCAELREPWQSASQGWWNRPLQVPPRLFSGKCYICTQVNNELSRMHYTIYLFSGLETTVKEFMLQWENYNINVNIPCTAQDCFPLKHKVIALFIREFDVFLRWHLRISLEEFWKKIIHPFANMRKKK